MNRPITQLLKNATSPSSIEEQRQAILMIAMLLEKNTCPSDENGFYEEILPAEYLVIHLNATSQAEILAELTKYSYTEMVLPSVFWAIGKALPSVAVPVLSRLIKAHPRLPSDPTAAYQAAISLENCLAYDRERRELPKVLAEVRKPPVEAFLSRASASTDEKLAVIAGRLIKRLRKV